MGKRDMIVFGVNEYNYFLDTCLKQITSRSYDEIEEDNVGEIIEFLIKNGFTVCECSVIIPFPIHQENYIVPTDVMYHFCAWSIKTLFDKPKSYEETYQLVNGCFDYDLYEDENLEDGTPNPLYEVYAIMQKLK